MINIDIYKLNKVKQKVTRNIDLDIDDRVLLINVIEKYIDYSLDELIKVKL